ncbi:probably inactive leucine-rich repeat receptor-like protein kinase At3g28040 [Impatiens glandulifera]|uniref:probably inactive leucine-rich repeat receptor-like protein kinase At3g28040 n=1 Tax=Impatiens glandulifera TaxID=253017 RepID=UPI001FB08E46|nr:probably inactive leucine-rich repeat receptor-like protein kinase At3g28040 [Impatiens glandulifera]
MWAACNLLIIFFSLQITLSSSLTNHILDPSSIDSLQLNDDILGLIVFKSDLHDPKSLLQSWNEDDSTPCSWQFIKCDPSTGKVSDLTLDSLALSGKIGRGLQKLQSLKVLSLSSNNLTGSLAGAIPANLERLNLSRNGFSGVIPESLLSNMGALKFLDLSENSFSGPISSNFFSNCPPLRFLSLAANAFEGSIPVSLKECSTLNSLNLSRNHFSGNPEFVGGIWSLSRLRLLDLSENYLSGFLPSGISFIHNLKELHLQRNQFSGLIPTDIGFCPHLTILDLSYNLFTGAPSESIGRLTTSLNHLSLSNNLLTGDFPQWVGNLESLYHLDLSNNGFIGVLPANIGDLKLLSYLSISNNRIAGGIPVSLVYTDQLTVIKLRDNILNGSIPNGLFNLGLNEIDFSGNLLSGEIPPPGTNRLLESLRRLDLSRNKLSGDIPAEIGLCSKLSYLNLSWNGELQSRIPPELGFFQNLTVLDLRNNELYGSIPGDICDSGSLQVIQLDGNSLTGSIPQEIGDNCSSLSLLTLSNNNLNGSIPKSIGMLSKLKILKLELNQLTGEIPPELGKLENLLAVNISYNQLTGRLPTSNLFQNLDQSALKGNLGICSPLLKEPCKMNVPKPLVLDPNAFSSGDHSGHRNNRGSSSQISDHHNRFFSVSAIVAISASLMIMVGVMVVTLLNMSARRRQTFIGSALEGSCSGSSTFHSGSPSPATGKLVLLNSKSSNGDTICLDISPTNTNLLNKATEIGTGSLGSVYKATFGSSPGQEVAIKKLVASNITPYQEEFDRHVRILAKAVHPNLVTLRGYYWTPELQLLVSDFIPNGTLQGALHERAPSVSPLSWTDRFMILLGVARGIAHLHHSFRPPIIHYNVKPSNVFLDESMNPKISDFGLVRLLNKHVSPGGRFQSTAGYFAPEMACRSLRVNEKCDVYSFGVMVLEVVTGRRPVEYGEDNVVILTENVKVMLERGNILECVDSAMDHEYPEDEVLPVLKLALVCTSQIPSSRPSMAEVVQILQVIKTPIPHRF